MANNRKLGRTADHRKAMLRNLATDLIMHGKIETTVTRAKEVRKVAEKLVTLGKRGDLHAKRQAFAICQDVIDEKTGTAVVQKLFEEVAPKYQDVNGGYTRILRTYNRRGDNAPMCILALV
jgi:ribosomal protein L17